MFNFRNNDDLAAMGGHHIPPPSTPPPPSSVPIVAPSIVTPLKLKEKVIAVIPVHGRHPLLKHTISRLLNRNGCHAVICAGDPEDKDVCEEAGAIFIKHDNRFLGKKWNACFAKAERMKPDAILFMGSSDWVSDNWLPVMLPHLNEKVYMIGKAGCYLLDISDRSYPSYSAWYNPKPVREYRLVFWPGYKFGHGPTDIGTHDRSGESIGIGRLISKRGLDKIGWKPFHDDMNESLDYCMYKKFRGKNKIIYDKSICSMAISCDKWPNKHTFENHWNNVNPSKRIIDVHSFCKTNFYGYDQIF